MLLSNECLFTTNVKIGSNKQEFNLILDTGSYYTWVAKEGSKDVKTINHHFNPSSSNTCVKTPISTEIIYGTGSCSGDFYSDNFYYINDKEFKMIFLVASSTNFNSADGIIGLGRSSQFLGDSSFIDMLKLGGVTNSKLFSFKFSINESEIKGTLIIGKHDDFSKTDVGYCPLINLDKAEGFWECKISSFTMKNLGNEIKIQGNYDFIFDTGTNHIYLPFEYFSKIDSSLTKFNCHSITNEEQSIFNIICSDGNLLPDFIFEINGNMLTIPSYFSFIRYNNNEYMSLICFTKSDKYFIGFPFFVIFHTLFDKENGKLFFYPEQVPFLKLQSDINIDKLTNLGNRNLLSYTHIIIIISSILLCIGFIILIINSSLRKFKAKNIIEENLLSSN